MRRHEPGVVWSLRADRLDYVRTESPDSLGQARVGQARVLLHVDGATLVMSRMDARLLARRITQMLEATK